MIRRAGFLDVDAVAELYERSFATLTFLPRLHSLDELRSWFDRVVAEQEVWVYERDGAIAGFAALDEEMLNYLYVEPAVLGHGIGTALLDQTKARRPAGFTFWVFQQNARARAFYERHGCRLVRLTDGEYNEEKTPDALYEWKPEEDA
jgi:ribosomal protein S18 acetylase RimI-like enzyme